MNERIKELAIEAENYADSIVDIGGEFHEAYTKKFAKLIIKECAELVEGFTILQELALDDYEEYDASDVLKKHFGVEE